MLFSFGSVCMLYEGGSIYVPVLHCLGSLHQYHIVYQSCRDGRDCRGAARGDQIGYSRVG